MADRQQFLQELLNDYRDTVLEAAVISSVLDAQWPNQQAVRQTLDGMAGRPPAGGAAQAHANPADSVALHIRQVEQYEAEQQRLAEERAEQERLARVQERQERERQEKERREQERQEKEQREQELREAQRREEERQAEERRQQQAAAAIEAAAVPAPSMAGAQPVQLIAGRWEVQRDMQLGVGAFGTVYKGTDTVTGSAVAVKIETKKELLKKFDPEWIAKLQEEMRIMRIISHPNIVRLHDAHDFAADFVLVFEFAAGGDLHGCMKRRPLQDRHLRPLFADLAAGMVELARHKIIHRDLKPQNLLLSSKDLDTAVLKIADFGFARGGVQPGTLCSTFLGTPLYMAPEVYRGLGYDARADLFSVGCLLYEMCAGRPPYDGMSHVQVVAKMEMGARDAVPAMPPACVSCVAALLAPKPEERATLDDLMATPWARECAAARDQRGQAPVDPPVPPPAPLCVAPPPVDPPASRVAPPAAPSFTLPTVAVNLHGRGLKNADEVLYVAFDAERARLVLGTHSGLRVYGVDPLRETLRRALGGVGAVDPLPHSAQGFLVAGGGSSPCLPPGVAGVWDAGAGFTAYFTEGAWGAGWAWLAEVDARRARIGDAVIAPPGAITAVKAAGRWLAVADARACYLSTAGPGELPRCVAELATAPNPCGAVAVAAPRGGSAVVAWPADGAVGDFRVGVWSARGEKQREHAVRCRRGEAVTALAVDPTGMYAAAVTESGYRIDIVDVATGVHRPLPRGQAVACVASVAFSADGALVSAASAGGTVHVWRAGSGEYLASNRPAPAGALLLAFCAGGANTRAGSVPLWSYGVETGQLRRHALRAGDGPAVLERSAGRDLSVPPPPAPPRDDAAALAALRARAPALLPGDRPVLELLSPNPADAPRAVAQLGPSGDTAAPVGIILRQQELVLVPLDPGRRTITLPVSWACAEKAALREVPAAAWPAKLQIPFRLAKAVRMEFRDMASPGRLLERLRLLQGQQSPRQCVRPECLDATIAGQASVRDPSPAAARARDAVGELWPLLLWQQRLARQDPRALTPPALRALHGFVAGPRPAPPPSPDLAAGTDAACCVM